MSPLLIGIIIAAVGLLLAVGGFIIRGRARRILSVPLRRTAEVAQTTGPASCEGAVRAQQTLVAPCSNTPCVYFQLVVDAKVKSKSGGQTQTKWKKIAEHHQGSLFALDDGSGTVLLEGSGGFDGELEQTFAGSPPGGPGLGAVERFVTAPPRLGPNDEIVGFKVTEKVVRADAAKLFALGHAQAGRLEKLGDKKVLVSTRGRDAIVGSAKMRSLILLVAGGLVTAGGATVAVLRPGEAPSCGDLKDTQTECRFSTGEVVEIDRTQPDGKTKKEKIKRVVLPWEVTKAGKYELAARDPKQRAANPVIQVENALGIPMNIDFGLAVGAGTYSTKTKTAKLEPGSYKIYVFSLPDGPSSLLVKIDEAAAK